jgi:hypothetical protein
MDADEPKGLVNPSAPPLAIETMLGYTGSVGTALWYEIGKDRGKVCRQCHGSICDLTIVTLGVTGGRGGLTWQAHCEFVESF